jgi:hypothetical protein
VRLPSKFKKRNFEENKSKKISEHRISTLILNPYKKLFKNAPKTGKSKTSLTNKSKSKNCAYIRQVFANHGPFFKTFSTDSKTA